MEFFLVSPFASQHFQKAMSLAWAWHFHKCSRDASDFTLFDGRLLRL